MADSNSPMLNNPSVTAGLMWAPEKLTTAYIAIATDTPQPAVVSIQPESWPVVFFRLTFAFTLPPRRMRRKVPTSSAVNSLTRRSVDNGVVTKRKD